MKQEATLIREDLKTPRAAAILFSVFGGNSGSTLG
jgi:hypothetical protein